MLCGLLVFTVGLILVVIEVILVVGKWFDLLASLIFLSGIAIALYGVLIGIRAWKSAAAQSTNPNKISAPEPTRQLTENGVPSSEASVTEPTTQLIERQDSRLEE